MIKKIKGSIILCVAEFLAQDLLWCRDPLVEKKSLAAGILIVYFPSSYFFVLGRWDRTSGTLLRSRTSPQHRRTNSILENERRHRRLYNNNIAPRRRSTIYKHQKTPEGVIRTAFCILLFTI